MHIAYIMKTSKRARYTTHFIFFVKYFFLFTFMSVILMMMFSNAEFARMFINARDFDIQY